jgi:hypothetical protein
MNDPIESCYHNSWVVLPVAQNAGGWGEGDNLVSAVHVFTA